MAKTTLEEKIAKLEAELKNAKASQNAKQRKERNQQLIAFGIGLELKYKSLPDAEKAKIRAWFDSMDERNKARAIAGFDRLDAQDK